MWQVSIYASLLQSLFPSSFHWEGSLLKQSEGASQSFVGIVDTIFWTNFMNDKNASLFLLQLSVIFILRIPFHQVVDTWCPLIKSFLWRCQYPLSPGSNLTSRKHFLRQVCRVEGPVVLGHGPVSVHRHLQRWTFSRSVSPAASSPLSPLFSHHKPLLYPYLSFSCFFIPFWQTEVFGSFPGSLGP